MKKLILMAIVITGLVLNAFPQKAFKTCDVDGYVLDDDPNGLNVRETPGKTGKVVGRLIAGSSDITLDIIGTNGGGWVKITNAWHGDDGDVFKGTGWVFATMLATGTKGYPNYDAPVRLYSSASKKSKSVIEVPSEQEVVVIDCDGKWAKVRYLKTTGWLAPENQCGNPFTTCS